MGSHVVKAEEWGYHRQRDRWISMEMTQKVQGGGVIVTLLVGNEGKPEHSIVVTGLETSEKGKIQAPLPTLPAHC